MKDTIIRDAEEFGVLLKQGGWRLGLLVARNVEHGTGGRRTVSAETVAKVSARQFAEESGTTAKRVLNHLDAWNAAAADGLVPPSDVLTPGEELDLDVDKLGPWSNYYTSMRAIDTHSPERRKALEAAAAEAGTTPDQINKVTSSRPALIAALKFDPKIRQAAREALAEGEVTAEDKRETFKALASDPDVADDLITRTTASESLDQANKRAKKRIDREADERDKGLRRSFELMEALSVTHEIQSKAARVGSIWREHAQTWTEEERQLVRDSWDEEVVAEVDYTTSSLHAEGMDDEIAQLLENEGGR